MLVRPRKVTYQSVLPLSPFPELTATPSSVWAHLGEPTPGLPSVIEIVRVVKLHISNQCEWKDHWGLHVEPLSAQVFQFINLLKNEP